MQKILILLCVLSTFATCIHVDKVNTTISSRYSVEEEEETNNDQNRNNPGSENLPVPTTTTPSTRSTADRPLRNENDKSLKILNQMKSQQVKNLNDDEITKLHQQMHNSKFQQSLNNLKVAANGRGKPQDQHAAKTEQEVQRATSHEQSTNGREFKASPELSSLYTEDQQERDHFHPTNRYYRPLQQDARYPHSPIITFPESSLDTKWLGASQIKSNENSFIHHEALHGNPPNFPSQEDARKAQYFSGPNKDIPAYFNKVPTSVENLNKANEAEIKRFKGYWKWVPEDDSTKNKNDDVESKIMFSGQNPFPPIPSGFGEHHFSSPESAFSRPTSKDRPYNFDSNETPVTIFHTTSSGGNAQSSIEGVKSEALSWTTSESPITELNSKETSSLLSGKHKNILDHKFKNPHLKKIFHVLAAAIPIGLLISALTPRVLYVHPNQTIPNFVHRPPGVVPNYPPNYPPGFVNSPGNIPTSVPPLQLGLRPNQNLAGGQPYPIINRQRSVDDPSAGHHQNLAQEFLKNPLMEFITSLESKFTWPGASSEMNMELENGVCDDRIFCEIAVAGSKPDAEALYKMLWKVANETPKEKAEKSGMSTVFKAIRKKDCKVFECAQADATKN